MLNDNFSANQSIFIHSLADVHPETIIGNQTKIWQFAVIIKGARIGHDCNICAHTLIEGNVIIGNHVTIKSGVYLWDGTHIEDNVFIGPNATFTNDKLPRSKHYPESFATLLIKHGASIGANATLLPGIVIGEYAMVGAGAVVTTDVAPYSVVVGNPAKPIKTLFLNKDI